MILRIKFSCSSKTEGGKHICVGKYIKLQKYKMFVNIKCLSNEKVWIHAESETHSDNDHNLVGLVRFLT
jgi:hypothetical protein